MNPIDTIKKGILNNDMEQVIKGMLNSQEKKSDQQEEGQSKKEAQSQSQSQVDHTPKPCSHQCRCGRKT